QKPFFSQIQEDRIEVRTHLLTGGSGPSASLDLPIVSSVQVHDLEAIDQFEFVFQLKRVTKILVDDLKLPVSGENARWKLKKNDSRLDNPLHSIEVETKDGLIRNYNMTWDRATFASTPTFKAPDDKKHLLIASLGPHLISYEQTGITTFSEVALAAKLS